MSTFLGLQQDRRSSMFAEPGDEGALVFDGEGKTVGLMSVEDGKDKVPFGLAYVVPIDQVFEDMKALGLTDVKLANA